MSVRAIRKLTGFYWDTMRKVQKEGIAEQLRTYERTWEEENCGQTKKQR